MPIHAPSDVSTVEIHTEAIREIADVGRDSLVVTAGLDRVLAITAMDALRVQTKYTFDVPLWCCVGVDENVIAAGGDQGKLFCVDVRSQDRIMSMHVPGPAVNSVVVLREGLVMALTVLGTHGFDLRLGKAQTIRTDVKGGIAVRRCPDAVYFTVLTRGSEGCHARFCTCDNTGKLALRSSVGIACLNGVSRPAMRTVNGVVHSVVPNEASKDFSVFSMSMPTNDIWAKWRPRWGIRRDQNAVLNVAITSDADSVLVASVTSDRFALYETPIT
jgi:hypothetical protein